MKNILFSYPHSSLAIPEWIEQKLNITHEDLVLSMDFGTQRFFEWFEATKLFAQLHFLFWNLNRNISGKHLLTGESYTEFNGLFPSKLSHNAKAVYKTGQKLSKEDQQEILEIYYLPYYKKLVEFILSGKIDFVVDVHSCDPKASGNQAGTWERADIILGNLWDSQGNLNPLKWYITFPSDLMAQLKSGLEAEWLSVSLNIPFSGGNITQEIGKKIPTLQIEINKRVFMTPDLLCVDEEKFQSVNTILERVFQDVLK